MSNFLKNDFELYLLSILIGDIFSIFSYSRIDVGIETSKEEKLACGEVY